MGGGWVGVHIYESHGDPGSPHAWLDMAAPRRVDGERRSTGGNGARVKMYLVYRTRNRPPRQIVGGRGGVCAKEKVCFA
jgi:hypothetical protein